MGGKLDRCMRVSDTFNAYKSEPLCGIERGCITGFEEGSPGRSYRISIQLKSVSTEVCME